MQIEDKDNSENIELIGQFSAMSPTLRVSVLTG